MGDYRGDPPNATLLHLPPAAIFRESLTDLLDLENLSVPACLEEKEVRPRSNLIAGLAFAPPQDGVASAIEWTAVDQ
jgi:hypothetical protein